MVVGEHKLVVAAWRDQVRPGENLLHIDAVDAYLRPGLHDLLRLCQLPFQEIVEQIRTIMLDQHKPLETQQVVRVGKGCVENGGDEIPVAVAAAIIGHHLLGQVKVAPRQQLVGAQDRQARVNLLFALDLPRSIPAVSRRSVSSHRALIPTRKGCLVHRQASPRYFVLVA